jgi:twitching motility protein PilT
LALQASGSNSATAGFEAKHPAKGWFVNLGDIEVMTAEQPIDTYRKPDHEPRLHKYFRVAIKTQANDLHLKVGQPPKLRLYGQLKNTTGEVLTQEQMEQMIYEILTQTQKDFFLQNGTLDFAHEIGDEHRFRVNIFRQRGMISLAARRVSAYVPSFESLHLPKIISEIAETNQGLVLVVGPTGCGKTTTVASMIDYVNHTRYCHIVTIEDPIEYLFKDAKAIVSQREIGIDVPDYEEALRYLMRQDPNVVFIGEMRDAKTVSAGMRAAETGHLVFGTMHSANASQAVHRILDLFPPNERDLTRQTLSTAARAIISQVLLPSVKEGIDRIPAVEVLLTNPAVRKLISEGREADLPSVIRSSQREGMQDITYNLTELVKNGFVDPKDAYRYAPNKEELKMALKGIRTTAEGIL